MTGNRPPRKTYTVWPRDADPECRVEGNVKLQIVIPLANGVNGPAIGYIHRPLLRVYYTEEAPGLVTHRDVKTRGWEVRHQSSTAILFGRICSLRAAVAIMLRVSEYLDWTKDWADMADEWGKNSPRYNMVIDVNHWARHTNPKKLFL